MADHRWHSVPRAHAQAPLNTLVKSCGWLSREPQTLRRDPREQKQSTICMVGSRLPISCTLRRRVVGAIPDRFDERSDILHNHEEVEEE
jgi:hypothetical protein